MIAFKEWQVICDALASGKQSIIFRKGGIHEGREGFSFKEENFFLFPTRFHAQGDQVRGEAPPILPEWEPGETVEITHFATAEWAETLTTWDQVAALGDYHIWTDECLKARFDWSGKGMAEGSIHVAFLRIHRLDEPISFPYEKGLGGCRSWVELPLEEDLEIALHPVVDDDKHAALESEIRDLLSASST